MCNDYVVKYLVRLLGEKLNSNKIENKINQLKEMYKPTKSDSTAKEIGDIVDNCRSAKSHADLNLPETKANEKEQDIQKLEEKCKHSKSQSDTEDNNQPSSNDSPEVLLDEEDISWDSCCRDLSKYIEENGRPPKTRYENPFLYDFIQAQKARQEQFESIFHFC